jgi:hypothetical protein
MTTKELQGVNTTYLQRLKTFKVGALPYPFIWRLV